MPQNFFVIGEPKAGKTTLLKEVIAELKKKGLRVGGFISPEERHHGTRTAFYVMDVDSGKQAELANVKGDGPKVSKYHVNVKSFESVAMPSMDKADSYDVFVIDEIGIMELKSAKFADKLDELIDSHVPLVATLHKDFVKWYGPAGEVLELSVANRQAVATRLLRKANESFGRREKKQAKPAPEKPAKAEKKPEKRKAAPPPKKAKAEKKAKKSAPQKKREPEKREVKMPGPEIEEKGKTEKIEEKEERRGEEKEEPEEKHERKKKKGLFDKLKSLFGG